MTLTERMLTKRIEHLENDVRRLSDLVSRVPARLGGGGGGGTGILSDDTPEDVSDSLRDGPGSAGVANKASRSDHVHAYDNPYYEALDVDDGIIKGYSENITGSISHFS